MCARPVQISSAVTTDSLLDYSTLHLRKMPPRKKLSTPARRGGKQSIATGLPDPGETESVKTPSTASLDKMAEVGDRENSRSPSVNESNRMKDDLPSDQKKKTAPSQTIPSNKVGGDSGPAAPLSRPEIQERLSHSATKTATNGNRQDTTVTYPDSEPEEESASAHRKEANPMNDPESVPQTDAEEMEVELEGEMSSREITNGSYSTEKIRHTSPISARVLQNVRALKEEILNGGSSTAAKPQEPAQGVTASLSQGKDAAPAAGLTPVTSHSSSLDECTRTLQERAASILAQVAKTPNSSPGGVFGRFNRNQQAGRFQRNSNSSPLNANSCKPRFPDAPSVNAPSNRSFPNNAIASSRSWTAGPEADIGSRFGSKRSAAESGDGRNFEADEMRDLKRQRNGSPVDSWLGAREIGRDEGQRRPADDFEQDRGRFIEQDRFPDQNRYQPAPADFRGREEGNGGSSRGGTRFEPALPSRKQYHGRYDEPRRDEERRPFSREDAMGRHSPSRDRYRSPIRPHDCQTNDVRVSDRPSERQPAVNRFTGPGIVPSHSLRPATTSANMGTANSLPPAVKGVRNEPLASSASQSSGPLASGSSNPLLDEERGARAGGPQVTASSSTTRAVAGANGAIEANTDAPGTQSSTKVRKSRFGAPLPSAGTHPAGAKILEPAAPLPSLTTVNLGRNLRDHAEPRTFGLKSVSGKSDDGRSVISDPRR